MTTDADKLQDLKRRAHDRITDLDKPLEYSAVILRDLCTLLADRFEREDREREAKTSAPGAPPPAAVTASRQADAAEEPGTSPVPADRGHTFMPYNNGTERICSWCGYICAPHGGPQVACLRSQPAPIPDGAPERIFIEPATCSWLDNGAMTGMDGSGTRCSSRDVEYVRADAAERDAQMMRLHAEEHARNCVQQSIGIGKDRDEARRERAEWEARCEDTKQRLDCLEVERDAAVKRAEQTGVGFADACKRHEMAMDRAAKAEAERDEARREYTELSAGCSRVDAKWMDQNIALMKERDEARAEVERLKAELKCPAAEERAELVALLKRARDALANTHSFTVLRTDIAKALGGDGAGGG